MLPPFHIVFISSWYPNRNDPTHGLFNKVFAKAAAQHHKVSVLHVCSDDHLKNETEIVEEETEGIYTCTVYYKKVTGSSPFAQLYKRHRFLNAWHTGYEKLTQVRGAAHLIQLNITLPAGLGVLSLAKKYAIPFVVNEGWSGYYPQDGNYRGLLQQYYTRKILRRAKAILPVSEGLKKAMLAQGLKGNYRIVPNAVDEKQFRPIESTPHKGTRFIHISSLVDREKNLSGILRAFAAALKQNPDLELHIVGDGPERKDREEQTKTPGISNRVHFKGILKGEELVKAINACDALVMFSHFETFGITVIEALSCGKPVIVARSGGVADLIGPELGLSVSPGDETALTKALLQMTETKEKFDPVRLRHFVTDRFTVEKVGLQLTEIYQSVLSGNC